MLSPVPPLAVFKIPDKVTAPGVAVLGTSPVEPAEKEVTTAVGSALIVMEPATFLTITPLPAVMLAAT